MRRKYIANPQSSGKRNFYICCSSFADGNVRVSNFKDKAKKSDYDSNWIKDMDLDAAENMAKEMSRWDKNNIYFVEYADYKNGKKVREESDTKWYSGKPYNNRQSKKLWREMQWLIK